MKKEINSKSKRKWIMGGLAAFASVALLTTGFAVWVVGTTQTTESKNVDVTVDTANNKSIVFTWNAGTDSAIELKESVAVTDGKIVNVAETDVVGDPLQISYAQSYIKYGSSYKYEFKSIKFSIVEPEANETEYASVKVKADANKLSYTARTGSEFTYITAPKAINISQLTAIGDGNTKTITIPEGVLEFGWGNFFDSKSPATYYNEKYYEEKDLEKLTTAADEITSELTAMHEQLDGKRIKLVATLSTDAD